MEREKELIKLINVLRRTSRMALQAELMGCKEDTAAFCTEQYNRMLARLKEIDRSRKY
jgi:cytochrome c oxidase assembly factor CtaG